MLVPVKPGNTNTKATGSQACITKQVRLSPQCAAHETETFSSVTWRLMIPAAFSVILALSVLESQRQLW